MTRLHGEYEVKMDEKNRLRIPGLLLRQLEAIASHRLVLNRGFEKCLILYPGEVWDQKTKEIDQLNQYITKNRDFVRYFYRGATEVLPDGTGRLLLPKTLLDHAGIKQDIILLAYMQHIEIWSKEEYLQMLQREPSDFAALAEEVFGKKDV
jgi:MraZ protein